MTNKTSIHIEPNDWVAEDLLLTITGLTSRSVEDYRKILWIEGIHYKHASPRGSRAKNTRIMYNRVEIDRWFQNLGRAA